MMHRASHTSTSFYDYWIVNGEVQAFLEKISREEIENATLSNIFESDGSQQLFNMYTIYFSD